MKTHFTTLRSNKHLLLFFAGWGMDFRPLQHIKQCNSDILICYDYKDLALDKTLFYPYETYEVFAWSMGVWAAANTIPHLPSPPQRCIAINGTQHPIDNTLGIAESIYNLTYNTLSEKSLENFYKRMCYYPEYYSRFQGISPQRNITEQKEELLSIKQQQNIYMNEMVWEKAYVSKKDKIFSPKNQINAWQDGTDIVMIDEPHWFDFQTIICD